MTEFAPLRCFLLPAGLVAGLGLPPPPPLPADSEAAELGAGAEFLVVAGAAVAAVASDFASDLLSVAGVVGAGAGAAAALEVGADGGGDGSSVSQMRIDPLR